MHFTGTKSSPQILLLLKHKMLSSHGGFLTITMCHQGETILSDKHTMVKQRKGSRLTDS